MRAGYPVARLRRWLTAVLVVDLALFNVLRRPPPGQRRLGPGPEPHVLEARRPRGQRPVHHLRPRRDPRHPALPAGSDRPQRVHRTAQRPGLHRPHRRRVRQRHRGPLSRGPRPDHNWPARSWDNLNVTTLLSLPSYFLTPIAGRGPTVTTHAAVRFPANIDQYNALPDPGGHQLHPVRRGKPALVLRWGPHRPTRSPSPCWARGPARAGRPDTSRWGWSPPAVGPVAPGRRLHRRRLPHPGRQPARRDAGRRSGGGLGRHTTVGWHPHGLHRPDRATWPSTAGCSTG